jgi:hypothetical protein
MGIADLPYDGYWIVEEGGKCDLDREADALP